MVQVQWIIRIDSVNGKETVMLTYTAQVAIWNQWDRAVDFGSPVTAWTDTMLEVVRDYGRPKTLQDVQKLREEVRRRDSEKRSANLV